MHLGPFKSVVQVSDVYGEKDAVWRCRVLPEFTPHPLLRGVNSLDAHCPVDAFQQPLCRVKRHWNVSSYTAMKIATPMNLAYGQYGSYKSVMPFYG
jgi:hypothetical protein